MKVKLEKLSDSLQKKRLALLEMYDAEELHQLRVGLRRMRSYLKSRSGSRARSLRHELGKLADATNPARDWDTLVEKACNRLDPAHYGVLEQELRRHQEASHLPTLAMLKDNDWHDGLQQWDSYIRRHPPGDISVRSSEKALQQARNRVNHAWQRADLAGSPRNWHKLRIALKDLRYRLEADPGSSRDKDASKLLKHCKHLQTLLGDWHDTVVHKQLVHDVADAYNPDSDIETLKVVREWQHSLDAEGQRCLETTRKRFRSVEMANLLGC